MGMGAASAVIIWLFMFQILFGSWTDFKEALRYGITPDIISMFRGDFGEDLWAEFRLTLWLLSGPAAGFGVYVMVSQWMSL
ncbi:hypothetical protein [Acanthopleuribacter pedis]|uniref:Uncharacterized protein n=1 Tax=Acanthopleuribacter pedis TaxID=442870 RepID=A0A8J7QKW4_9BACT|nr:hypothetical protein [Acanthopleuribacter pedis]MBO1322946.1 hypothetical protein [Acanthopleuribacter pedis]